MIEQDVGGTFINAALGNLNRKYVDVVYHVIIVAIGTLVVKDILAFGNRLRSTHYREFLYMKLCRPAYFVRTTKFDKYNMEKLNSKRCSNEFQEKWSVKIK